MNTQLNHTFINGKGINVALADDMDPEEIAAEIAGRYAALFGLPVQLPWYRDAVPGWVVLALCVPLSLAMLVILVCLGGAMV